MNPEIKISKDGDKWCALVGENLQEGNGYFGDSPYEVLEMALEAQPDYLEACDKQSATIRLFEFVDNALDIRFIFHPALTPLTQPSVVTKGVELIMAALKYGAQKPEEKRIIT